MGTTRYNNSYYLRYKEDVNWWLRSPGKYAYKAAYVNDEGRVYGYGNDVNDKCSGVRPALYLNLSSDMYSYAGTVCSDGTVNEQKKEVTVVHMLMRWGQPDITIHIIYDIRKM